MARWMCKFVARVCHRKRERLIQRRYRRERPGWDRQGGRGCGGGGRQGGGRRWRLYRRRLMAVPLKLWFLVLFSREYRKGNEGTNVFIGRRKQRENAPRRVKGGFVFTFLNG